MAKVLLFIKRLRDEQKKSRETHNLWPGRVKLPIIRSRQRRGAQHAFQMGINTRLVVGLKLGTESHVRCEPQ